MNSCATTSSAWAQPGPKMACCSAHFHSALRQGQPWRSAVAHRGLHARALPVDACPSEVRGEIGIHDAHEPIGCIDVTDAGRALALGAGERGSALEGPPRRPRVVADDAVETVVAADGRQHPAGLGIHDDQAVLPWLAARRVQSGIDAPHEARAQGRQGRVAHDARVVPGEPLGADGGFGSRPAGLPCQPGARQLGRTPGRNARLGLDRGARGHDLAGRPRAPRPCRRPGRASWPPMTGRPSRTWSRRTHARRSAAGAHCVGERRGWKRLHGDRAGRGGACSRRAAHPPARRGRRGCRSGRGTCERGTWRRPS